ncbi:MAG: hypothetical protein OHK0024_30740 [Thalassobaculales bacterium]
MVATREPGGPVRDLLVTGEPGRWDAAEEALLNYAQRHAHWRGLVAPALAAGKLVLCDRFADSTMAYQGYAGGLGREAIEALHRWTLGDCRPDLTLVCDLPAELGLARARGRGGPDRFERKGLKFHQELRAAFLDIAAREPARCAIIDATRTAPQMLEDALAVLQERLRISA